MTHFHGERIDVLVSKQRSMVRDHVLRLTETDLQAPLAELMAELVAIYAFEVPVLDKENIEQVEKGEWARAGAPPYAAKALRVVFAVPFVGQKGLFSAALIAPKSGSFNGSVRGGEDLLITVTLDNPTADLIQRDLSTQVAQYEAALDALRGDVQAFNHELPNQVRSLITSRTAKLKRDSAALAELPFRVRRREDALIPVPVKKVVRVARAEHNSGQGYAREHVVPDADYDEILASTRSMGKVMERSPGTFSWLTEEGIRDFFLIVLNFGFRGEAFAEVFHGKGRTDILILVGDQIVFIAECKVWEGAERFKEAVDQLLDNVRWRDTKCAILLFVRETSVTTILERADKVITGHTGFDGTKPSKDELERRYAFHWRDDQRRELSLTLQVFSVPETEGKRSWRRSASEPSGPTPI